MAVAEFSSANFAMTLPEATAQCTATTEPEPMYLAKLWDMTLDQSLKAKERDAMQADYFSQYTRWKSFQGRLATAISNLGDSEFWNSVCEALHDHGLREDDDPHAKPQTVVCLCLGHLEDNASVYQLSLLILLLERLSIHHENCFIFDPCHSEQEADVLKHLGFTIMQENAEAKIRVHQKTLFYMPHGDYHLTDNLIGANYDLLHLIGILGNDMTWTCDSEAERIDSDKTESRAPCVQKFLTNVKETHLHDTLSSKVRSQLAKLAPRAAQDFGRGLCDMLDCSLTTFPPKWPCEDIQRRSEPFSAL